MAAVLFGTRSQDVISLNAPLNKPPHKWILLVADGPRSVCVRKGNSGFTSKRSLRQASYESRVNKHRLINKHANETFLPFVLCALRYWESWLARETEIVAFEGGIGHLIVARAALISARLGLLRLLNARKLQRWSGGYVKAFLLLWTSVTVGRFFLCVVAMQGDVLKLYEQGHSHH